MKSWRGRVSQGSVRALVAALVLAGVFAMHGLTGNHDAAMALAHRQPAHSTEPPHSMQPAHSMQTAHSVEPVATGLPQVATGLPQVGVVVEAARDGHLHTMGDVCLAILVGLALAIAAALALRNLRVAHPPATPVPVLRSIAPGPAPPWLQPTLSKLCVLRT